ncbi:hypothetical protein HKCCE4037_19100, partial [Rhodobacterales bacterium HKCCE4037]|nr:hypothetical protein [Rhodobacterales bacterium HKCCE4037]
MIKLFVLTLFFSISFVTPSSAQVTGPITCDAAAEGTMIYNADHNVPQFCDGTNWYAMIGGGGSGGGGGSTYASNDMGAFSAVGASSTWAHGQGTKPDMFGAKAVCMNASCGGGYSAGDEVWVGGAMYNNENAAGASDVNLFWNRRASVTIPNKSGGSFINVAASANWNLVLWGVWADGSGGGGSGSGSAITENDVTSSRSLNTVYQNTGTLPKLVTITHLSDT